MQHEKANDILNIYNNCVASCANSHIINLLYSGKFANVNLTQSKLAKSLHLKIGAKIVKKLNINKLNHKIMTDFNNCSGLRPKILTKVDTQLGYMQLLEYVLQDYSYLHVLEWYFNNETEEKTLIPKVHTKTFYKDRDAALKAAHKIGNKLLLTYL